MEECQTRFCKGPEGPDDLPQPFRDTVTAIRSGLDDQVDFRLEEMAADFGGSGLQVLFAVMLTHRISDVNVSNRAVGRLPAFVLVAVVFGWMVHVAGRASWVMKAPGAPAPTTYGIGEALLTQYALPFEVASIVLLAALIGAVVVSRKEVKG